MIAKRGSNALGIPDALSRGGRGLLATASGAVACELVPVGLDANGARYELRVTNGTPGMLAATVTAVRVDEGRPIAALAVEIEPHAAIRTGFTLDARLAYERVAAEVRGDGIHLIVEAPPPSGGRARRRWLVPVAALGIAGVIAGAVLVVVGTERPRVVDAALLATPDGRLVARWTTSGSGKPSYELRDARGEVVAHGELPSPSGQLELGRGDAASLRVAIANSFGSDVRDAAYGRATPPPAIRIVATPPPRIESIAIDPPRPNAPLTVRYAAQARDLRLAIVDRTGATYFSTSTGSGAGMTQIPAPPAGPREPYALVATAEGADAGQQTRIPIPAAVTSTPSPVPSAQSSAVPNTARGPAQSGPHDASNQQPAGSNATVVDVGGGDTFAIRPNPVKPGDPFVVEIPFSDGARVQIVRDRDDVEMTGADLRRGERSVAMTAPTAPGSYTVRVTMQRGVGLETVVRPLRLAGR
ncbi:MAG TPA: hypothetical protein VK669_01515 [Candidatus Limnocylindrales bacterium]|nr:hypothetical protein [Candidatus Limnocylindrales bacterium]